MAIIIILAIIVSFLLVFISFGSGDRRPPYQR